MNMNAKCIILDNSLSTAPSLHAASAKRLQTVVYLEVSGRAIFLHKALPQVANKVLQAGAVLAGLQQVRVQILVHI